MYQPKKYKKNSTQFAKKLIKNNPFAQFIIQGKQLLATHIPIMLEDQKDGFRLVTHLANNNPQADFLHDEKEALLIFSGPDAYISSSWYEDKNISTWDYSAVHINCKIKIQTKEELVASLKDLVYFFEKEQANPLFYKDLPDKLIEEHLPGITGFYCYPQTIRGVGKWHQTFDKKDVKNIITELQQTCPHNPLINDLKKEHDL